MFLFLQETWLPNHESKILSEDFGDYSFHTSSSDSFTPPDRPYVAWHRAWLEENFGKVCQ